MSRALGLMATLTVIAVLLGCSNDTGSNKVLATIDGKKITSEQFDAYLKFKRIPGEDVARRTEALEDYLRRERLAAAVEKSKKLDKLATETELREFRKDMLINRYFDQFLDQTVTDEAVRQYYGSHVEEFEQKKVRVAHVLFRTNNTMSEAVRAAKKTAAQEAMSKLKKGSTFEELVASYSDDTVSKPKNGEIGWIKTGDIDPEFSKAAFAMKTGDVSEVVETRFGYHIVRVLEGPLDVRQPLESVAGDIRYRLRNEAREQEMNRLLGGAS